MNQEQAEKYLVELYQEWYKEVNPIKDDPDTIHYAPPPSFETIRKIFITWLDKMRGNQNLLKDKLKAWFEKNQDTLKENLCSKWNDLNQKNEVQKIELLAVALTVDGLAIALSIPTVTMTTASILVIEGYLDRLCSDYS